MKRHEPPVACVNKVMTLFRPARQCLTLCTALGGLAIGCGGPIASQPQVSSATNQNAEVDDFSKETKLTKPGIWQVEAEAILNEAIAQGKIQSIDFTKLKAHVHVVLPPSAGEGAFDIAERKLIPDHTQLKINLSAQGSSGPVHTVQVIYDNKGVRSPATLLADMTDPWRLCHVCAIGYFPLPTENIRLARL